MSYWTISKCDACWRFGVGGSEGPKNPPIQCNWVCLNFSYLPLPSSQPTSLPYPLVSNSLSNDLMAHICSFRDHGIYPLFINFSTLPSWPIWRIPLWLNARSDFPTNIEPPLPARFRDSVGSSPRQDIRLLRMRSIGRRLRRYKRRRD